MKVFHLTFKTTDAGGGQKTAHAVVVADTEEEAIESAKASLEGDSPWECSWKLSTISRQKKKSVSITYFSTDC